MKILVKFHRMALPSFAAWRRLLISQPPYDPKMYDLMRDAMCEWFRKYDGQPPECVFCSKMDPPRYVARFTSSVWVHFVRKLSDRGRTMQIYIIAVADSAPE